MFKYTQFKAHPHDLLVRLFLNDKELFADFLCNYLDPDIVKLIDLDRLVCMSATDIDGTLTEHIGDLRFSAVFKNTGAPLEVFIFLEHQSTPLPLMAYRILKNIVDAYGSVVGDMEQKDGKEARLFPYPLAILLYHGKMPWREPLSMRELIAIVPGLNPAVLDFPIHLVDLSLIPTEKIKGHPALQALLMSLQAASLKRLGKRFEAIFSLFTALKPGEKVREWMQGILTYVGCQDKPKNGKDIVLKVVGQLFGPQEGERMAKTWGDEMFEEAEAKGLMIGRAEGKAKGKAEAVLVILSKRFASIPADVREQVMAIPDESVLNDLLDLSWSCKNLQEFANGICEMTVADSLKK